jgi:hypothetical protein
VKLGKSATETPEMFRDAFGEYFLRQTVDFEWHSHFKAGQVSVEDDECSGRPSTRNQQKFENSSTKTVTEQSMNSQTPLRSVMEFARRSYRKI